MLLQEDPASGRYRQAREALRAREYERAAALFESIRAEYPESAYAANSYYYQALALQRSGGGEELRMAAELLAMQQALEQTAAELEEVKALQLRIQSELARRGSAESYRYMQERARQECGEEDELRMSALAALASVDPEKARPILLELLQERGDCSAQIRQQAIFLLARQEPDAISTDLLVDLVRNDPDPEVRAAALFWLGQVEGPERTALLEAILESEADPELQAMAIHSLARGGGDAAAAVLIEYASRTDLDPEVRAQAIHALGQRPGPETQAALRSLYGSTEGELKLQILYSLSRDREGSTVEFLREIAMDPNEEMEIRMNALLWLSQREDGLRADDLMRIYRETSDVEIKQQILMLMSQTDDPAVVDLLIEAAQDTEHPELRQQAIMLLGQSEDPRAADALMELIRGG
jgi:HEAT repeat protein